MLPLVVSVSALPSSYIRRFNRFFVRSLTPLLFPASPPPKTINKEWEEASNQRALEQKMDPISGRCSTRNGIIMSADSDVMRFVNAGIASEGYSGKGFVTHK